MDPGQHYPGYRVVFDEIQVMIILVRFMRVARNIGDNPPTSALKRVFQRLINGGGQFRQAQGWYRRVNAHFCSGKITIYQTLATFVPTMANNQTVEELARKEPGTVVGKIMEEVLQKKAVDVHFEEEDDQQWAIVKVHNEEEDLELGIRLYSGEKWALQIGYYDDEDEFIERLQPLGESEIVLIPGT